MERNKPVSKGITLVNGVATSSFLPQYHDRSNHSADAEVALILQHLFKTGLVPTAQQMHYKTALFQQPSYFHNST